MKKLSLLAVVLSVLCTFGYTVSTTVQNESFKTVVKKIISDHADSLVWIRYTTKGPDLSAFGMPSQDQTTQSHGIIISENGVIATRAPMPNMNGGMVIMNGGDNTRQNPRSQSPKNIKVVFSDGKAANAESLLIDPFYSLMFVKIKEQELKEVKNKLKAFSYNSGTTAELGDEVITLERRFDKFGFVPRVNRMAIDSVMTEPINSYGGVFTLNLLPVFNASGVLIGFTSPYNASNNRAANPFSAPIDNEMLIIPFDSMKQIFEKAKKAKPQGKSDEEDEEDSDDEESEED
ncbi:MAG: serine protease [Planctomycetes bacterium]|nr:serine protease [Planctomycetota bacterium]